MVRLPLVLGVASLAALVAGQVRAENGVGQIEDGVASANAKVGAPSDVIDPNFNLNVIATRIDMLENPSGPITFFGQLSTGALTEPDENTYLVLDRNPGGPTPGFDYGRRFLFQGHENGSPLASITPINLGGPRASPPRITP